MSLNAEDSQWMAHALCLAKRGRYTARPNPCVGCVLVKVNQGQSKVVGEGWHYRAGEPHAEVNAIAAAGIEAKGATAYVTLEPCNHQGRTGPCTQALIRAGVERVVYAMQDPNPLVAGQGLSTLKDAGVKVDGPLLETEARALNLGFISRMERQRPWVRFKVAISLDGRTAMANGESQWITGTAARADVQKWRARSSAIVSGIGSIVQDNSRLTLRKDALKLPNAADVIQNPPLRVLLDSQLTVPLDAEILSSEAKTLVITTSDTIAQKQDKMAKFGNHVLVEAVPIDSSGKLSLQHVLALLAHHECNEVLLETGSKLAGAFLQQNLIDEFLIYQAPLILGSEARPMFELPLQHMVDGRRLDVIDKRDIGGDQRMIARMVSV